jgi:hypothetical protein
VLPNGQTLGQVIRQERAQLQEIVNIQLEMAQYGVEPSLLSTLTGAFGAIARPNGPIDFKNNFRTQGNGTTLGLAGNFAYYAIGSGFLPNFELDAGAGAYGIGSALFGNKPFSSLTGPMYSDTSAASVRDPALAANGCP